MRNVLKFLRQVFTSTKALVIIALLAINILTVTSFKMFDIVSSLVRMATVPVASLFDEKTTRRRPTWGEAIAQTDDFDARNRAQSVEIESLKSRNVSVERNLELSTTRNRTIELELSQKNSRHANEVAGLMTENSRLRTKLVGQSPTVPNKAMRKEVRERTRRLMQRISRSTALEVSSAPAELSSVGPGTLVALGLLIYEVRDTCLQMSELKELYNLVSLPDEEVQPEVNEMDTICGLSASDLKTFIFSKTPQEACSELRAEMQQVNVPGCEDFPVQNSDFEIPNLSDTTVPEKTENHSIFVLPELD